MPGQNRRTALCEQLSKEVTGIDFVQVVVPMLQTVLHVYFIVEPDELDVNPFPLGPVFVASVIRMLFRTGSPASNKPSASAITTPLVVAVLPKTVGAHAVVSISRKPTVTEQTNVKSVWFAW